MKILELGSGAGEVMMKLYAAGHEVEGIDQSPGFFGGKKMDIYQIDEFFKEKFDMVLLQMPLGLDIKKVIEKVLSVLNKDGVFYVITEREEVISDLNKYWKKGKIEYGIRSDIPLSYLAQNIGIINIMCEVKGIQCITS
jgi:SAM-dependent methyltransferase